MNYSLSIHNVTSITVSQVREISGPGDTYASRTIEINTKEGSFELVLFSPHVGDDHDSPLLEMKL
jgi:hypothetical protein